MSEYFEIQGRRFVLEHIDPPIPAVGIFWRVLGDEELAEFNNQSRTLDPNWAYLPQTPSVFRFEVTGREPKSDYRVDISPLLVDIFRLNNWTQEDNHAAYLFSAGTALFNNTGYPKQQYLTMSFNLLEEIAVEGAYLKFKTITPATYTAHMKRETHPQFIHKWDIVTSKNKRTVHVNTPHGDMFWFLCSKEGFGYIPLRWVRRLHG